VSTASSGEALQSLGAALRGALARVRGTDDLYEVACGVLRHHLGPEVMLSLYEEDAGRVWLRAQRGYAETIHSHPLGDGLIAHTLRDDRPLAILAGAASDPRCIALGVTAEAIIVAPFTTSRVRGALVLESLQPLERTIVDAAIDAMRAIENAVAAMPSSELERPTGARWLSRSFLRLASTRDRDALFELTARLVGEVLDVDCVQAAEGSDELLVVATCHAGRERVLPLPPAAINALARASGLEQFRLHATAPDDAPAPDVSLEGRCEMIGMPMRSGDELLGFIVASSSVPVEIGDDAFEQAELLVAQAATALSTLRMLERSERAAVTDALTGLWNHRRFYETSLALIEAAPEVEFALVLADLDDFKELNDRHGHVAGDDALRSVANVLRRGMRPGDSVFRVGGEEFALLLPSTSRPNARTVCRRLQRTLETLDLGGWRLTLSFGIARSPDDGSDLRTLMQAADAALYEAKRLGKDRITMASERLVARRSPTMKARTRRGFEQMRLLEALVARLGSARTARAVARELLGGLREVVPGDVGVIWSLTGDGPSRVPLAGGVSDPAIEQALRELAAEALAEGRTRLRDDVPGAIPPSALAAPLGSPPLALLGLTAHEDSPFDRDDLRLVELAARVAGLALANSLRIAPAGDDRSASSSLAVALARCETVEDIGRVACTHTAERVRADRLSMWQRVDKDTSALVHVEGADEENVRRLRVTRSIALQEPGEAAVELVDGPPSTLIPEGVVYGAENRMAIVPIAVDDVLLGSLVVSRVSGPDFQPDEISLLEDIAAQVALALHAQRATEVAEAGLLATIESLVSALEIQDPATSRHALAIVELAARVGRRLGLPPAAVRRLEHGAALHDIGKIGVASDLLRKPGPLDEDETRAMRCHPELGARILEPVPRLRAVAPIVRASHERFDGQGYPDGLAGDAIPLESRIVAVCDAFDAMVSDRPYRSAMSRAAAVLELRVSAGTQFDPLVVDAFLEELGSMQDDDL
jgi:diguanylate cyclase (GGDEF)-like protein